MMTKNSFVLHLYYVYIINVAQIYMYIFRDNISGKKRKRSRESEHGPKRKKRKIDRVLKEINELSVLIKF